MGNGIIGLPIWSAKLHASQWSVSSTGDFAPGEIARRTNYIWRWFILRVGLYAVKNKQILSLPGIETPAAQYVVCLYTDWDTTAPLWMTISF